MPHSRTEIVPTHVEAITEYLEGAQVPYELVEHEPVMSAAAEAAATGERPDHVAKTIVLHDSKSCVIAAIPASERLDLHKLRSLLGATRQLQFASEEQIARDFPSLEVGAVPPFGPMVPAAEVLDRLLLAHARILCPAGDHRHSLLVDPRDVLRITAARTADICQDQPVGTSALREREACLDAADDPGLLSAAQTSLPIDQYELAMAASHLERGMNQPAPRYRSHRAHAAGTLTMALARYPILDSCPADDPGHVLDIGPSEPVPNAVFAWYQ